MCEPERCAANSGTSCRGGGSSGGRGRGSGSLERNRSLDLELLLDLELMFPSDEANLSLGGTEKRHSPD